MCKSQMTDCMFSSASQKVTARLSLDWTHASIVLYINKSNKRNIRRDSWHCLTVCSTYQYSITAVYAWNTFEMSQTKTDVCLRLCFSAAISMYSTICTKADKSVRVCVRAQRLHSIKYYRLYMRVPYALMSKIVKLLFANNIDAVHRSSLSLSLWSCANWNRVRMGANRSTTIRVHRTAFSFK